MDGNDFLLGEGGQSTNWEDHGTERDVLDGGLGSDVLAGGVSDILDGGGNSIYSFDLAILYLRSAVAGVVIDMGASAAGTAQSTGAGGSIVNIENIWFYGGSGADRVTGGLTEQNKLEGGLGADTLTGGDHEDEITGQAGNDSLVGGGDRDTLEGSGGDDIVFGGDGDDWLFDSLFHEAGGGNDTIDGGAGDDLVEGRDGDDVLNGGDGDDRVGGDTGADKLSGGAGDDLLGDGSDGARDTLLGGEGADVLQGGLEVYDGGTNAAGMADMLSLDLMFDSRGVTLDIAKAAAHTVQGLLDGGSVVNVERLSFHGGDGANKITGYIFNDSLSGGTADDTLSGGAGDDNIFGGYGGDDVISGGAGADTLAGYFGIDTLTYADAPGAVTVDLPHSLATGAAGTDSFDSFEILIGSRFSDDLTSGYLETTLIGGIGNDVLRGFDGGDRLDGGAGDDRVDYGLLAKGVKADLAGGRAVSQGVVDILVSIENANGTEFADTLAGTAGSNRLNGAGGNDVLDGGGGSDVLQGGAGVDTVTFGSTRSALVVDLATGTGSGGGLGVSLSSIENATSAAGGDSLRGDDAANRLDGAAGADTLLGREGDDVLIGGLDADRLEGGEGSDLLSGGDGADVLIGGLGADRMDGGGGADAFVFADLDRAKDRIGDLEAADVINIKAIDADATVGGDQKFVLVERFGHHAGEARLVYDVRKDATSLQLDVDGDGKADMTVKIAGDHVDFSGFVL